MLISGAESDGLYLLRPPCLVVAESAGDDELGAAVRAAADRFEAIDSTERPSDATSHGWEREILDTIGVKDWGTLERGAKRVDIEPGDFAWRIVPLRRHRRGGWGRSTTDEDLPGMECTLLDAHSSAEDLGAAVRRALAGPTPTD